MEEQKHLRDFLDFNDVPKNNSILLYDNDDTLICTINDEIEFAWVRTQIAKHQIKGCYVMFYHNKININLYGIPEYHPNGMMDAYATQLAALYHAQQGAEFNDLKCKSTIIDINKCPINEFVDIYDNENNLICHTNSDLQYNWVRAEIKEKKLKGCYIMFRGERIDISEHGDPYTYPNGFFEFNANQLCRLI